jgi:hypothetical protein
MVDSQPAARAVALFPWVALREPLTLGPVRLLPYKRATLPGDLPHVSQADLDGILGAYADRPGVPVERATLLEIDDWRTGTDETAVRPRLFRARTSIAFAALSERRLFIGHFGYCNYDTYMMAVQRYQAGQTGRFSFTTRRRDGSGLHYWTSDEFAFQRPQHVDARAGVDIDAPLAQRLIELMGNDDASTLYEAISEFNAANTDSQDIPTHVELIMTKSAFELLLDVDHQASNFVNALLALLPSPEPYDAGPLQEAWGRRFPKATRPIEEWAREFCDLRGSFAHGRRRESDRFVWSRHAHLAFASMLFPLAIKAHLARQGHWQLSEIDTQRLRVIDAYVTHDPFKEIDRAAAESHPWADVDSSIRHASIAKKLYAHIFP